MENNKTESLTKSKDLTLTNRDDEIMEFNEALKELNDELRDEVGNDQVNDKKENEEVNEESKESLEQNVKEEKKPYKVEELKEYIPNAIFTRINYDLTSPMLTTSKIKDCINDGASYKFRGYEVLSSKIKFLKKEIKNGARICSVVGFDKGECSSIARMVEVKQAKSSKVSEVAVFLPLSLIGEGIKKPIVREFARLKKICGKNIKFKVAINCDYIKLDSLRFAVDCAIESKADSILLYNYENADKSFLHSLIKNCPVNCLVEVTGNYMKNDELNYLINRRVDIFSLKKAVATAETIKHSEN